MKKKIFVFVISAALTGVCLCTSLYAYLSSHDNQINYFTAGQNSIEIKEEFPTPDPKPGGSIKKVVTIKNNGDVPCFVRTQILFSNGEAEGVSTLALNKVDWTERQQDGYYYYRHILPVGKSTPALLTAVKIAESANLDELKEFEIFVYSESVQAEGFREEAYLEAFESLTQGGGKGDGK